MGQVIMYLSNQKFWRGGELLFNGIPATKEHIVDNE